jgi:hypothetical protein
MIVKIKLKLRRETFTMMFGNSYKDWDEQFREYCSMFKPVEVLSVVTSKEKWIGWGGLKWCNENEFQNELNREGCQEKDFDNPNPRDYSSMNFKQNQMVGNMARKIAERYI